MNKLHGYTTCHKVPIEIIGMKLIAAEQQTHTDIVNRGNFVDTLRVVNHNLK